MSTAKPLIALVISLSLLLMLAGVNSVDAQAQNKLKIGNNLTVVDLGAWRAIYKGVEFRKVVVARAEPNYQMELKLVRFDGRTITPRILSSGDFQLKSASGKTFVEKSGALAAINANYFDEKGRPLDRKSTRLNSSHIQKSRMPSSA